MAKIRKITADHKFGMSYIYLEKISPGEAKKQVVLGSLVLDFSSKGKLLGIEVLDSQATADLQDKNVRKSLKDSGISVEMT